MRKKEFAKALKNHNKQYPEDKNEEALKASVVDQRRTNENQLLVCLPWAGNKKRNNV